MNRRVILDVDPGIDDAVAICMALFDPRLDVVAITAVGGNITAEQATRNVQAVVEQIDPPRLPRIGCASDPEGGYRTDARHLHGANGLGNAVFQVAELHHQHPSEKVICDEVRAAPEEITIVALGPLTNIAKAFVRDPELPTMLGQLIIMGGTAGGPGNVTPAAEFNFFSDPDAARLVIRSATTKTLIPLDVVNQVVLSYDLLDQLPPESTGVGRLLGNILPFLFRAHHQQLGQEGIHLGDAVALLAASDPGLFETVALSGDVETTGELTIGATVFDRRVNTPSRPNMEVATNVDVAAAKDAILRGLARATR